MPVTATALTSALDSSLTSTKTTASVTLGANQLVLLAVSTGLNSTGPTATVTSVTSTGATWVKVNEQFFSTNQFRIELWRTMVNPSQTGAITINLSAVNNKVAWALSEFANVPVTGANGADAIIQSATNTGTTGTSLTVTLASFADAGNATFGTIAQTAGSANPVSGFTELHDVGGVNPHVRCQTEWKNAADTTVDWAWSGSGGSAGIGVEIGFDTGTNTAQALAATSTFTAAMSRTYGKTLAATSTFAPAVTKGVAKTLAATSTFAQGLALTSESLPGETDVTLAASSIFTPTMDAEKRGIHGNYEGSLRLKTNYRGRTKAG